MDDEAIIWAAKKLIAWLLLGVSLLFLLSGFGMVYPDIIGPLTLGVMAKSFSIRLHEVLWAPFLALLFAHFIARRIK